MVVCRRPKFKAAIATSEGARGRASSEGPFAPVISFSCDTTAQELTSLSSFHTGRTAKEAHALGLGAQALSAPAEPKARLAPKPHAPLPLVGQTELM